MVQYINKSDLVAEIEKCYNECLKRAKITDSDYWSAKADAYRNVLVILNDTLELKEVNLEYEIEKVKKMQKNFEIRNDTIIEFCAKHFFELGLSVNNPITAADRGTVEEIILALNTLGKEKMISYDKEIEWLNKLKEL